MATPTNTAVATIERLERHGEPDREGYGSGSLLENTRVAARLLHKGSDMVRSIFLRAAFFL